MTGETTEPKAWLVRGSKNYAFDQWMLDNGYTAVDFHEVGDLNQTKDLAGVRAPFWLRRCRRRSESAIRNHVAQLNAFANRIGRRRTWLSFP